MRSACLVSSQARVARVARSPRDKKGAVPAAKHVWANESLAPAVLDHPCGTKAEISPVTCGEPAAAH